MRRTACITVTGFLFLSSVQADDQQERERLIKKFLDAAGGVKLAGIKAFTYQTKVTFPDGRVSNFQTFRQLPINSRTYTDIEFEGLRHQSIIVVNAEKAWRKVDSDTTEMTEEERQGYLDSERIGPLVALMLKDPAHSFSLLGESKIGARPAIGLKMTHTEFREYQLWFDKETGLLGKIESKRTDDNGKDIVSESLFHEYKEIDGIPIACRRTNTSDGNPVSETNYADVEFVEHLEPELFDRP